MIKRTRSRRAVAALSFAVGTLSLATPSLMPTSANAASKAATLAWKTYVNDRYGYSVDYPSAKVVAQPEAQNGDGLVFQGKDGASSITIWAAYNVEEYSVADGLDRLVAAVAQKRATTLTKFTKDGFVASGYAAGKTRIWYHRVRIAGDTIAHVELEYPAKQKAAWDPIVTRVSSSFTLPG